MSEYFVGITFPQQKVTPSDDAAIRRAVLADSILSGCALSYAGSTLTMGAGLLIACGRQFRHTSVQNWAVTGATSGYARLVLTVDTTRASTKESFDQIVDSIEYASSLDGFLQLQQDDINEAGTVYQMAVCVVSLGAGGITGIIHKLGANTVSVVIPASGWVDNKQTIPVLGVSADYAIAVTADETDAANSAACGDANVKAFQKTNGSVTFRCDSIPDRDLLVHIALRV